MTVELKLHWIRGSEVNEGIVLCASHSDGCSAQSCSLCRCRRLPSRFYTDVHMRKDGRSHSWLILSSLLVGIYPPAVPYLGGWPLWVRCPLKQKSPEQGFRGLWSSSWDNGSSLSVRYAVLYVFVLVLLEREDTTMQNKLPFFFPCCISGFSWKWITGHFFLCFSLREAGLSFQGLFVFCHKQKTASCHTALCDKPFAPLHSQIETKLLTGLSGLDLTHSAANICCFFI